MSRLAAPSTHPKDGMCCVMATIEDVVPVFSDILSWGDKSEQNI